MTRVPSPTPAASRRYPRPGSDGPVEPTAVVPDDRDDPTPVPAAQQSTPKTLPPRIRPHGPPPDPAADNSADPTNTAAAPPGGNPPDDDESTDIRIAPHAPGAPTISAEDQQFNLAGDYFLRKEYTQAAADYERYLGQFADGKQRQAAYWWLGESYRLLKKTVQARSTYQQLVIAYQDGEFVGPACLRLATIDYESKDYRTALPLFQRAATLATSDAVRLLARYYEAVCLEQLGRRDDTRQVYEEILAVTKDNPYRDDAHLALANIALSQHHPNEAFKEYDALSREGTHPGLQAEASLKAGLLAQATSGRTTPRSPCSTALPASRAATPPCAPRRILAQLHLLYDTNKYKQLLEAYPGIRPALPANTQPEAMLLAANSHRQLGKHAEARALYDDILDNFPRTSAGARGALPAHHQPVCGERRELRQGSRPFPGFRGRAGQDRPGAADEGRHAFQGRRLHGRGAGVRRAGRFRQPARQVQGRSLLSAGVLLRAGAQTGADRGGVHKFLENYPESPLAAKAFVQRAGAYQQLQNYPSALADFNEVINDHKEAKEREFALEQKALILGQQKDDRGMAEAFRALLKDYPKTEVAGLAHFSIARAAFEDSRDYSDGAGRVHRRAHG